MTARDPRPRVSEVIKLCYSEEKYLSTIKTGNNGQALVGKGALPGEAQMEIYASNILGYGGSFSVYIWEKLPDGSREICRVINGRNLEVMSKPGPSAGEPGETAEGLATEPGSEETVNPAPEGKEEEPIFRHRVLELQTIPGQSKPGNNPTE